MKGPINAGGLKDLVCYYGSATRNGILFGYFEWDGCIFCTQVVRDGRVRSYQDGEHMAVQVSEDCVPFTPRFESEKYCFVACGDRVRDLHTGPITFFVEEFVLLDGRLHAHFGCNVDIWEGLPYS